MMDLKVWSAGEGKVRIAVSLEPLHRWSMDTVGITMIYSSFVPLLCCASTSHVYGYTHPGLGEMCQLQRRASAASFRADPQRTSK